MSMNILTTRTFTEKKIKRAVVAQDNPRPAHVVSKTGLRPFEEGVMEIKEKREVPVLSKETRVVEEVSLNKEITSHQEKVEDSAKKTEIEIEDLKNSRKP